MRLRVSTGERLHERSRELVGAAVEREGHPLERDVREEMEARFRVDLSRLRVHTDGDAAAAAGALDARALALGRHLLFGPGEFAPDTVEGRWLLAHEIAHGLQDGLRDVPDGAAAELAPPSAETEARLAASGEAAVAPSVPAAEPRIGRFVNALPLRESAMALADPFVETMALDVAKVVERDSAAQPRIQRRLGRLNEPTRAAVISRVQELLTPAQRESAGQALTAGAIGEHAEVPVPETEERPPEAVEPTEREQPEPESPTTEAPALEPLQTPAGTPEGETPAEAPAAEVAVGDSERAPAGAVPAIGEEVAQTPGAVQPVAPEAAQPNLGALDALDAEVEARHNREMVAVQAADAAAETAAPPAGVAAEEPAAERGQAPEAPPSPTPEAEPAPVVHARTPGAVAETDGAAPGAAVEPARVPDAEPVAGPAHEAAAGAGPGPDAEPAPEAAAEAAPEPAAADEPPPAGTAEPPSAEAPAGEVAAGAQATGDCGPDAPGGGGGGAAVEDQPAAPAPDVSTASPPDAMRQVASLPPAELGEALTAVQSASRNAVGDGRQELAVAPPSIERPSGSPETRPRGAAAAAAEAAQAAASQARAQLGRAPAGAPPADATTAPLPPAPPSPAAAVTAPPVGRSGGGELSAADAQAMASSVRNLPVEDPALEVDAGPAPTVPLVGAADPERAEEQRRLLEQSTSAAHTAGRAEAAAPAGEADIYPDVPAERLTAQLPAAAPVAVGELTKEQADAAEAAVAREEHSEPVRAAADTAASDMESAQQQHDADAEAARTEHQQQMDEEVRASGEEQRQRRSSAQRAVARRRADWREEQDEAVETSRRDGDTELGRGRTDVAARRRDADRDAARHIDHGNRQVTDKRREATRDARTRREQGTRESGGILGWLADRATAFFNRIKEGIQAVFAAARAFVRRAIAEAQRLANAVIDAARDAVVGIIRGVGAALLVVGDVMLAAFPEMRQRYRAAVENTVNDAVDGVNQLADDLKEGVRRGLTLLGSALDGLLNLLERGLLAAVDAVNNAVQGAIRAARAALQAYEAFKAIIADAAANPGAWIRNLGAAVVDGIRNHLWPALKCAVKGWFNSKVEEILGLARMIFDLLRRGGITFAQIGRMVWEALKASLPGVVIQMLVEKLVSLLVPAASALMLIIDGLRAAWGAVQRIIAAFNAFIAFLRAVKTGNAGPQFAALLSAAATAVIDFIANFVLLRLRGPAQGVAGRLRGIAQRIGQRARAALQAVRRVAGRAVAAVRRVGGRALGAVGRGARELRRVAGRLPGVRQLRRAFRAGQARVRRFRARRRRRAEERRRRRREDALARLQRAAREVGPLIQSLVARGASRAGLWARMQLWRARYRLRSLSFRRAGNRVSVEGRVNPVAPFIRNVVQASGDELHRMIRELAYEAMRQPAARQNAVAALRQRAEAMRTHRRQRAATGVGTTPDQRQVNLQPGQSHVGQALLVQREDRRAGWRETLRLGPGALPIAERSGRSPQPGHVLTGADDFTYGDWIENVPSAPGRSIRQRDREVGTALQQLHMRGRVGGALGRGPRRTRRLQEMYRVFMHVEPGRAPSAMTLNPLLMNMAAEGNVSARQALHELNVVSGATQARVAKDIRRETGASRRARGANAVMREVDQALGFRRLSARERALYSAAGQRDQRGRRQDWNRRWVEETRNRDVEAVLQTEKEVLIRWLDRQMRLDPHLFRDAASLREYIRAHMRDAIRQEAFRGLVYTEASRRPRGRA